MVKKCCDNPHISSIYVRLPDNPLKNLNVYVIQSEGETLIIDTGFHLAECRESLWEGIRELDLDMKHTSLFLTHLHADHIGLVEDFTALGCTVYMGRIDYELEKEYVKGDIWEDTEAWFVAEGFPLSEIRLQGKANHARIYGPSAYFPAIPVDDGDEIKIGKEIFRCILTPGHTPGHMVLYMPEPQILFSGDHVLFDITPNITVYSRGDNMLGAYLDSLKKIRVLPANRVFPAHRAGDDDLRKRIDELLAHHRKRLREIVCAVMAHPDENAFEVASRIGWSARGKKWEEFPPNQKWFAVGETLAHLQYLRYHNMVRSKKKNGIRLYHINTNVFSEKDMSGLDDFLHEI